MALGADRVAVMAMVLREAGMLLMVGLAAGLVLTLAAGRLAGSLLYGVAAWDPLSLGVAFDALAGIGLMAAFVPARRAARLDPMTALREE